MTVQHFLYSSNIYVNHYRVHGVAECILHELKSSEKITVKISEMYDTLIGDDLFKTIQLKKIGKYWRGEEESEDEEWESDV